MLPIRLLREVMLKDKAKWDEVLVAHASRLCGKRASRLFEFGIAGETPAGRTGETPVLQIVR